MLSLNLIARMSLLKCVSLLQPIGEVMIYVYYCCYMQYTLGHSYVCFRDSSMFDTQRMLSLNMHSVIY